MNNKSKIKSIKSTIGWGVSILLLVVLTYMSVERKKNVTVTDIEVNIHSPKGKKSLITSKDVRTMMAEYLGYDIELAKIKEVKLMELEDVLNQDRRVKRAEVYMDGKDQIRIAILERNIVMRIQGAEVSYYLDDEGVKIPSRKKRAVRVPVVTGDLEEYTLEMWQDKKRSNLEDVWRLAREIEKDAFLTALIEQIHVEGKGHITMVPKMGKERITLTSDRLDEKLFNLKVFYKDGLPKRGWSKYATLNLDVKGQVVAEKIR